MGRLRIEHSTAQESSHALYSLLGGVGENITGLGVCWVVLGVGVRGCTGRMVSLGQLDGGCSMGRKIAVTRVEHPH